MNECVITGSRRGHPLVTKWMEAFVERRGPTRFILGDAKGVDKFAMLTCQWHEWPMLAFRVDEKLPSPERFRLRDALMVESAQPGQFLLAFPREDSKGTWLTYRLGEKRGLQCFAAPVWDGERLRR